MGYIPMNLYHRDGDQVFVTSEFLQDRRVLTPATNVRIKMNVLTVQLPFERTQDYSSKFVWFPAGTVVDKVLCDHQTAVSGGGYVDRVLTLVSRGISHVLLVATETSVKWPAWTSSWANSYDASASCEFHWLGRLSLSTSWGDYLVMAG